MTTPHRQEALSRAYVAAVAAQCGMSVASYDFDYGIDLTLNEIVELPDGSRCPGYLRVDIQVKSTVRATLDTDTPSITYDLNVRNYNFLRDPNVPSAVPRILVLLVMPRPESEWMKQNDQSLMLRQCAYWASFKRKDESKNKATVRVKLKQENIFSSENLRRIMDCARDGKDL